jgi:RNA polymerase sigma-70 factor (ECF subfamily)
LGLFTNKEKIHVQDEVLLTEYRNSGDIAIVGEIYKRYAHLVFGVCMKYLKNIAAAEDMSMHVFEKLISDLKEHDIKNFRPWLHMVTRNECLMQLRRSKKMHIVDFNDGQEEDEDAVVEFAEESHLDDVAFKEVQLDVLEAGIKELGTEQKVCIELFYLEKKSYQEVAEQTGYDINKVKSYIQNGKRNLRIYMEKRNAG